MQPQCRVCANVEAVVERQQYGERLAELDDVGDEMMITIGIAEYDPAVTAGQRVACVVKRVEAVETSGCAKGSGRGFEYQDARE